MLTRHSFRGPWAGLPVAWTPTNQFDEATYRGDVARCCLARVPGVYSGGTSGEHYAMEFDEFKAVARATVQECHAHGTPAMVGCTSTYTLGAVRRAAFAGEIGADAVQAALPYWMEVGDAQVVPFFQEVAAAAGGLPLSIYETTRTKKPLTLDQHRAIKDAVPRYLMVKANAGTVGTTPEGCAALAQFLSVFVNERQWEELWPRGACGCCSAMVYWNPRVVLDLWHRLERDDWPGAQPTFRRIAALHAFLHAEFVPKGFTDTAFDRTGGLASGFLHTSLRSRGPYPSPTADDVEALREWYRDHFPEMLEV